MEGDRVKCVEVGCSDYAPQPIEREELFAAMGRRIQDLPPVRT